MFRHIFITFALEVFHNFPEASEVFGERVAFLEPRHRHMFHFKLYKAVEHNDRDVEFILFKQEVMKYLTETYGTPMELGRKSCEDLAEELLTKFTLVGAEVSEDGENGAAVSKSYE